MNNVNDSYISVILCKKIMSEFLTKGMKLDNEAVKVFF